MHWVNDILVRKQARSVRTKEYLILDGEIDWGDGSLRGAFRVMEIKTHTSDTLTFMLRPEPLSIRCWPGTKAWKSVDWSVITVGRSQIMTRYSGALPPPSWVITEVP